MHSAFEASPSFNRNIFQYLPLRAKATENMNMQRIDENYAVCVRVFCWAPRTAVIINRRTVRARTAEHY